MQIKKKRTKLGLASFLLLASIFTATAQTETRTLSMNEAISTALKHNKQILNAELDEKQATTDYKKSNAIFMPQIGLSYTAMMTNDPLNVFGFKLEQKTVKADDFNPTLLNDPKAIKNFNTNIEVQMPLVNIDQLYMRKAASAKAEASRYGTIRMKDYIAFEVKKAYLQLQLAYQNKKVLEEALHTSQRVYTTVNNFFMQGLIRKSDVLNAKVHVSGIESNLERAKSGIANASEYLNLLMGNSEAVVYQVPDSMSVIPSSKAISIPLLRADFMAMQKAIDATALMQKSHRYSLLPRLNAFGNYAFNDSKMTFLKASNYMVGIRLSWTLFNGQQSKYNAQSAGIMKMKLQEQLSEEKMKAQLEYNKTHRELDDISFELQKNDEMVQQAREALRIITDRFDKGLEKTTDVLMAQTQLSSQQLAYTSSVFKQNLTAAYLDFITSETTYHP